MVKAIILAGGKSSRFKTNKMSTILNGKPILLRTIEPFIDNSLDVVIVTGYYNVEYLKDYIDLDKFKIVHNKQHELGMFSSILKGVKDIDSDILLSPGDYPNIQSSTIQRILEDEGDIRVPTFKGRKGHPIFISKRLVNVLKKEPINSNLKVFRDRHQVNYIEVDDDGIFQDIDFYDDYKRMKERKKI